MIVARTWSELGDLRGRCVVVPTMGALHEGHASLIRLGVARAREAGLAGCVVTVFVNPTQFDVRSDLERYPRTLEHDVEVSESCGAAGVYAPEVEEVYPPDGSVGVPPLPAVACTPGLEDATRPGHFAGVCQVVRRLFELVDARSAVFGEKDWQQLQVVRALVREQGLGVEIVAGPTVREADGLALSSRNVFLSASERARALSLYRGLRAAGRCPDLQDAQRVLVQTLRDAGAEVNYAAIRDAETLMPTEPGAGRPMRALVNAKIGTVRLLDNAPWPWE